MVRTDKERDRSQASASSNGWHFLYFLSLNDSAQLAALSALATSTLSAPLSASTFAASTLSAFPLFDVQLIGIYEILSLNIFDGLEVINHLGLIGALLNIFIEASAAAARTESSLNSANIATEATSEARASSIGNRGLQDLIV